jgi:hypothetical protein
MNDWTSKLIGRWLSSLYAVQDGIRVLQTRVDGVFYPTWIPKDFAIILNCSTWERWPLPSMTDFIHT